MKCQGKDCEKEAHIIYGSFCEDCWVGTRPALSGYNNRVFALFEGVGIGLVYKDDRKLELTTDRIRHGRISRSDY